MDYVTDVEYEAECVEYDSDDKEKISPETSNTSWNKNQIIENESFEKEALSMKERSSIIEELQKLFKERQKLTLKNIHLQQQICSFLIKSRNFNAVERITIDCLSIHSDYSYKQVLEEYEDFEIKLNDTSEEKNNMIKQHQDLYEYRVTDFNLIFKKLKLKLSGISLKIKSHDREEKKDLVLDLINKLQNQLEVLTDVRIRYFKLKYNREKLQSLIKTQTQIPKDYSLANYENLKIMKSISADEYEKNQTDLKTVKEKLNSTVKVLGHVQQALDVITNEVHMAEAQLKQLHNIENEQRMELIKIKKSYYLKQNQFYELQELNTLLTWISHNKSLNNSTE